MKLIKETEIGNFKFKYYLGFNTTNFDDSDETTFTICFIKENENHEQFPESNMLLIYEFPECVQDIGNSVEIISKNIEKRLSEFKPWHPVAGITVGKIKNNEIL